ncbi:NLR family CARD domain-containing protein 4 [Holothuria leucospilota]|uniref:NLR family CARD domain-containing protein 4 n=1 Tax=Holothuria leucospilota TaxID=206669 RepID=A0A9Q1BBN5_HOLLE|nr:NLR family CARD domain-containing protein 4 [Holothuria leucospilota]
MTMTLAGLFTSLTMLMTIISADIPITPSCDSPQYLNFGATGTLNCVFHEEFFSVLWYNTTDYSHNDPILHYQNLIKSGSGYDSGEYDIHPNGSLVINEVLLQHETVFTVAYVQTKKEGPKLFNVLVVTIVQPEVKFPCINICGNHTWQCYTQVNSNPIQCTIRGVRPNVTLKWMARTKSGDMIISNEMSTASEGLTYTSQTLVNDIFRYSPLLVLLVCIATSQPGLLENNESMILVQNGNPYVPPSKVISRYIQHHAVMNLSCSKNDVGFVVWKKADSVDDTTHQLLVYSVFTGNKVSKIFLENAKLENRGSLVVPSVEISHEGVYYCIFGDGISDGVKMYDVTVIGFPQPPYLMVEGCNFEQHCSLEVKYEGSLTCSVKAIRPQVQLNWRAFYDRDIDSIHFTSHQLQVKENGEKFDVTLTTMYHVIDESRDQLTVECVITETNEMVFDMSTKVDMLFVKEEVTVVPPSSSKTWIFIVFAILVLVALAIFATLCIAKRLRNKSTTKGEISKTEEKEPMFTETTLRKEGDQNLELHAMSSKLKFEEMKQLLIDHLKEKYKDLYDAIQPIPYIRDRLYCVDNIFVEGGIELLCHTGGADNKWERLNSYNDIFNDQRIELIRLILEGEPGYGKSTVTLQLAFDWCNQKQSSKLKDTEILILLRLRQLGGVPSILTSIKHFLLPRDSLLQEGDIATVLSNTESVVVILDGYDEYPDQDKSSDVMKILGRDMFQKFQVILTTRSSCLPKRYSPQTKRVRLTGFDHNAQENYIRKALMTKDNDAVEKMKSRLQENPLLSGLSQVPLFFVMFAHMLGESKTLSNFDSVTSFFHHMISCFHEHMKIKMADENVKEYELFENDHQSLDKVAFEALSGKNRQIVWMRGDLRRKLGKNFYDAYIRIGILVEEEVLRYDKESTRYSIQKETEVRFYHKLFCEWYAAHYLSKYATKSVPIKLGNMIKKMSPFDLQYLYRFACGIDATASGKIIKHIKKIEGGDRFAILCILEQTGTIDNVKDTIRQLCAEGITISDDDSLLLQMSSLQLLEIAGKNEIPVSLVRLHNSLESVNLSTKALKTNSGISLTSVIPMKRLQVSLTTRAMTTDEAVSVLKFSSHCPSLKDVWYLGCVPPRSFEDHATLSTLQSRDVKVQWRRTESHPVYVLNLQTGCWENENDGSEPTTEDFERTDWVAERNKRH